MSNKNGSNGNGQNHFVGSYVDDVRDVTIAGLVSGQNVMLLGAPGFGKTAIARDVAERVASNGEKWSFNRLDPSTPVETVAGAYDPAALLDGRLERVTDGTPYQPGNRIAILDEMFRASEPMFDKLLDVCDRKDVDNGDAATVVGTANFVAESERTEALIDRFAFWYWVDANDFDAAAIVDVHLGTNGKPTTPGEIPTWDDVARVRAYEPTAETMDVVKRFILTLVEIATPEGRKPHPRRLAQWSQIVYRVSAYEHGAADFDTVSPLAARVMRFAWPNTSPESAGEWATIVAATIDPIDSAVDEIMADAVTEFRRVAGLNPTERPAALNDLGAFNIAKQNTLNELARQYGDDPRIENAIIQLTSWFGLAASGMVDAIG